MRAYIIVVPIIIAIVVALLVFQPGVSHAEVPEKYKITCVVPHTGNGESYIVDEFRISSPSLIIYFTDDKGYHHYRVMTNCIIDEI